MPFLGEDGKPYQYLAIRADITDRKRAEEELRRAAAIIENSNDAIIGKIPRGRDHRVEPGSGADLRLDE